MEKADGTGEAGQEICAAEHNSSTMKGGGRVEGTLQAGMWLRRVLVNP